MKQPQLKSLVENGGYRPQPELVADAMLRRRGVRAFLTGGAPLSPSPAPLSPADRIQSPSSAAPRQAA